MSRRSSSLPLLLDAAQSTYDFIPATSITVESIPREMTPHSVIAGEDRTAHPLSQVEAEWPEGWVQRSYMLCIPMHKLSHPMQFGVCFVGVIFFYLLYGYSQVHAHVTCVCRAACTCAYASTWAHGIHMYMYVHACPDSTGPNLSV